MNKIHTFILCGTLGVALGFSGVLSQSGLDVPYVPTPMETVERMLEMAEVRSEDTIYDLGCGDGRIVITAAERYNATGVGVDLNPTRIEESRRNARNAGVSDRVEFVEGDLFGVDLSPASIVTLYLLPDVNIRLRPKLFRELQPGSRVVSHDFHMGDWEPDVQDRVGRSRVYFWVIPANVSGRWQWSMDENSYEMDIEQRYQQAYVTNATSGASGDMTEGSVSGKTFAAILQTADGPMNLSGTVEGDVITGTAGMEGGSQQSWQAERVAGTQEDIAE